MGTKRFDGSAGNKAHHVFDGGAADDLEAAVMVLYGKDGEPAPAGTAEDPIMVAALDVMSLIREGEANVNTTVLFEQDCRRFNHMCVDLKGPFSGTISIFVSNDPTDPAGWRAHPDTPTINTVDTMTNFVLKAGFVQMKITARASGTAKVLACFKNL